jgi:hypothetical protein
MLKHFLKLNLHLVLLCGLSTSAIAQSFPLQWSLTDNGRKLVMGKQDFAGELYDSSMIRNFYLDFSQANYWQQMQQNYQSHTEIAANLTVDNVLYPNVGVRFKGNTSYTSMLVQNSQKKSFNIALDFTDTTQDLMGYNTLNLNNSYEDPSFLREVFYLHQIRKHIPAAQANFVHLYINNADWGIYPNVQQLNKDYLKEWYLSNDGAHWRATVVSQGPPGGGWGDGTAALNYLGSNVSSYQQYYTLKTNDVTNPWDYLVEVCDKLNNTTTANLPSVLPAYLDIDRTLWFLASEIGFSDDDSYVYKGKMDYYVYYEPETGRMVPHEFDGNSAFYTQGVNWGAFYHETNVNYPLLNKILAVPQWRQRYLAHLRTVISEELDTAACNAMLNNYNAMINSLVQSDPKKLYSYNQYTTEITALKNFVVNHKNVLQTNSEVAQVAPVIANAIYHNATNQAWVVPASNEDAHVTSDVTSTNGIYQVKMYYSTELVGNFTEVMMYDDGAHNDGASGDGSYGATIPGQASGTWVRYYVEAAANNAAHSVSYLPVGAEHDVYIYNVAPVVGVNPGVVINEVMAANASAYGDNAGEYDDWIELYNKSANTIDISGYYLTDNFANLNKWEIPVGTSIPADGYLIFWADEDSAQGTNHANFKLSGSGEFVYLLNPAQQLIDSVSWGQQTDNMGFARIPNGTGNFIIQAATFGFNNQNTTVENIAIQNNGIVLYPNPAVSSVNILIPTAVNTKDIVVTNSVGQEVYRKGAEVNNTINLSNLSAGMYIVTYNGKAMKLLVQH